MSNQFYSYLQKRINNKPNHRVYKFQLILMKFPNVHIVWTEGRNLSLPDLQSCSLTTTTQNEHRLRTVEIPDSIKFFMMHNQNTQSIRCHYLPVSHTEFKTKAQFLENLIQQKLHQIKNNYSFPENYQIIQHTDVTLNTNKREPFIQCNHNANYAELINSIKFSLQAMDYFIPKSPTIYNYLYEEQTEIDDTLLYKTQQQDLVLWKLLFWKQYKKFTQPLHSIFEQIKDYYTIIDVSKI